MLKSLKIENFRCFPSFEMQQLGRLNLIVGTNNSGKTSILEAIQLLYSESSIEVLEILKNIMLGRGEYISDENRNSELDIRHLFGDHEIALNSHFSMLGNYGESIEKITMSVENNTAIDSNILSEWGQFILAINHSGSKDENEKIPLSSNDAIPIDSTRNIRRLPKKSKHNIQFLPSSSLTATEMIKLFDQVVLTPDENLIAESLQFIEKNINRIATFSSDASLRYSNRQSRGGFKILLSNKPIPIGSMGEGIWRMLGIALTILNAKDGVLLVDEIDTGLHFTVMSDMWKMLWETAKRLNVQIFATTHSNDCWQSLADIANAENPSEDGITIHRVEKGKPNSIVFTERQITIAAERHIEVR